MANLDFKLYVTKGELATIMGLLAYGTAKYRLRSGALGDDGLAIIELLDEDTSIALDNPEVTTLLTLLLEREIISMDAHERVVAFIASRLGVVPESPAAVLHHWRLPAGVEPSDWFVGVDISPGAVSDGYMRVTTTADTCAHPDAVMEV